jgi:hypothetical protein
MRPPQLAASFIRTFGFKPNAAHFRADIVDAIGAAQAFGIAAAGKLDVSPHPGFRKARRGAPALKPKLLDDDKF